MQGLPEPGLPEPERLGAGLPSLAARRSRLLGDSSRRGLVLSTASTVVVLAVLLAVFLLAPGSAQVRHTFLNPADMWQAFVGDPQAGYYSVGEALWLNIRMFVVAEIGILIAGLGVAVIRQSTGPVLLPLRVVATIYVDVARGVPLILIIFALGYGLPALRLTVISDQSAAVYGVAALVVRTRPTCRRSTGPGSTRCTAARSRRPARSACRSGPRCGT